MDIVVLKPDATEETVRHLVKKLESKGLKAHVSRGTERTIIGVIGDTSKVTEEEEDAIRVMTGVENVMRIIKPYKLASRDFKSDNTLIDVGGNVIAGKKIPVVAGPCSVENRTMSVNIAEEVKEAGATFIRGGAFKPRTSPYAFQGLGEEGLQYLAEARKKTGLPIVTEVMDPRDLDIMVKYADVIQIGARNMQNFRLLTEVGKLGKPVILKRGLSATIVEWLMSAEYIASEGNRQIILCERGIRSFDSSTRNLLDLAMVPNVKGLSHLPIIVDPSHATGRPDLIPPCALAGVAVGADGVHIEVHDCPERAKSDGPQALLPQQYADLVAQIRKLAELFGKTIARPAAR